MVCCYCKPPIGGAVNHISPGDPFDSLNIEHFEVSDKGITLESSWLTAFNFNVGSKVSCLLRPGYLVITNQSAKLQTLNGIEELQFRQDESKRDFSMSIAQLAQSV